MLFRSTPATTSDMVPDPPAPSTLTAMMWACFATPYLVPAIVPCRFGRAGQRTVGGVGLTAGGDRAVDDEGGMWGSRDQDGQLQHLQPSTA